MTRRPILRLRTAHVMRSVLASSTAVILPPVVVGCVPLLMADVASEASSGKSLSEHWADGATGKDCRVIEGVVRSDRKLCEQKGSPATDRDFKGIQKAK